MSQQGQDAAKRSKKRKLKQVKPILEQLPAVPADAQQQQHKHKHKRQHRQPDKQEPQQQQEQQPDALGSGNSKFARALGSTDFHTREQGLQALSRWLTHKQLISDVDMLKLWKGIYFCFWHSDKEPVQEDLAERLSGLIPRMQPAMAQLYWSAMLCTLRSEWFALDRHRLNKFLMLVRKFVAAVFTRLAAADWDVPSIRSFTTSLPLVPHDLIPVNSAKSLGLSYHLADVWLPELRAAAGQQALPAEALVELLAPFQAVLQQSGEAALVNRVREAVFEALVQDLAAAAAAGRQAASGSSSSDEGSGSDEDEEDGSSWGYCQELDVQQYAALLFDSGAQTGVKARNREALYATSKDLERVAGKRRKAAAAANMLAAGSDQPAATHQQQQKAAQQQQLKRSAAKEQELSGGALTEGSTGDKKKEKKKQQEQQQTQALQNGVTPQSSKKHKKQQQVQEPAAKAAKAGSSPAAATAPAAATPAAATPSSSRKAKKHHKDAAAGSKQVAPAAAAAAAAAGSGTGSRSAVKRGVKIDLKHNLYFEHGAPPPDADVRTPPRAKPKGSALKAAIKLDSSGRPSAPHTAPPAVAQQQQGQRRVVTPKSVPRLRAAEFF